MESFAIVVVCIRCTGLLLFVFYCIFSGIAVDCSELSILSWNIALCYRGVLCMGGRRRYGYSGVVVGGRGVDGPVWKSMRRVCT